LFFPINKALWTSSFVLYTGGLATICLAFCYWMIDVNGRQRFTSFFIPFGVNAITAYVLSNYIPHYLGMIKLNSTDGLYQVLFIRWLSPINASLAMGLFWVILIWFVMWVLWRRRILIKI
jgi:predicted acyltransferase